MRISAAGNAAAAGLGLNLRIAFICMPTGQNVIVRLEIILRGKILLAIQIFFLAIQQNIFFLVKDNAKRQTSFSL
jgi:hypothetical protein